MYNMYDKSGKFWTFLQTRQLWENFPFWNLLCFTLKLGKISLLIELYSEAFHYVASDSCRILITSCRAAGRKTTRRSDTQHNAHGGGAVCTLHNPTGFLNFKYQVYREMPDLRGEVKKIAWVSSRLISVCFNSRCDNFSKTKNYCKNLGLCPINISSPFVFFAVSILLYDLLYSMYVMYSSSPLCSWHSLLQWTSMFSVLRRTSMRKNKYIMLIYSYV